MILQAFVGFIMIEWAFYKTRRYRDGNEDRDSKYPGYRRLDVSKWARWKFYPGALIIMPTKCFALCFIMIVLAFFIKFACIGHDFKVDGPLPNGWRKTMVSWVFYIIVRIVLIISGTMTTCKTVEFDYTQYLGEGYLN